MVSGRAPRRCHGSIRALSDPTVVDVHVHVFAKPDDPMRDGYDIWEYGQLPGVEVGERRGTVDDLLDVLVDEPCAHCVVLGMFVPEAELAAGVDPGPSEDTAHDALRREWLPDRLRAYNQWILETAQRSPHLTPLIAADPSVLGGMAGAAHVRQAADAGAKGIKIHPVVQGFFPDDPRMEQIYTLCEDLQLTVLSHSGTARTAPQFADPFAFAAVMEAHPRLHLLLAHLGGASWHQVRDFAAAFPSVSFDLCEIIAWTGAPGAPTADELGRLIHDIGADRVLFGTDFPWYDLDRTIDQLMGLPHLCDEERRGILGENAIRRMGLDLGQAP
jgi:predicted TIM-barrel fold metal-dependent hydrolase